MAGVAHELNDVAIVLRNLGINDFVAVSLQRRECRRLIGAHQPAITDYIGAEDRGESTFFALRGHRSLPEVKPD